MAYIRDGMKDYIVDYTRKVFSSRNAGMVITDEREVFELPADMPSSEVKGYIFSFLNERERHVPRRSDVRTIISFEITEIKLSK